MFFEYTVNYLPPDGPDVIKEHGLTYASKYTEATNKLMRCFGEENIVDIYLQAWDCYDCVAIEEIKEGFKLT
jgi:hypothetical protein